MLKQFTERFQALKYAVRLFATVEPSDQCHSPYGAVLSAHLHKRLCRTPKGVQKNTSAVQDNALNLSISLSAGKENNSDALSNSE